MVKVSRVIEIDSDLASEVLARRSANNGPRITPSLVKGGLMVHRGSEFSYHVIGDLFWKPVPWEFRLSILKAEDKTRLEGDFGMSESSRLALSGFSLFSLIILVLFIFSLITQSGESFISRGIFPAISISIVGFFNWYYSRSTGRLIEAEYLYFDRMVAEIFGI